MSIFDYTQYKVLKLKEAELQRKLNDVRRKLMELEQESPPPPPEE